MTGPILIANILYNNGLLFPRRIKKKKEHLRFTTEDTINCIMELDHMKCYRGHNQKCIRSGDSCPFKNPDNYYESYFSFLF